MRKISKKYLSLRCGDYILVEAQNRIFDGAEYSPTKITFRSLDGIVLRRENLNSSDSSDWSSWCRIPDDIDPVIRVTVEYVECGYFVQRVPKKRTVELEISTCIGSDNGIIGSEYEIRWSTNRSKTNLFFLMSFLTLCFVVVLYLSCDSSDSIERSMRTMLGGVGLSLFILCLYSFFGGEII